MASSEGSVAEGSKLKSAQVLLDLVKAHLATDAGKDLQQKIGYTYQINIAPKVALLPNMVGVIKYRHGFMTGQKIGIDEESFVVDLKNLKVYKGKCEGKPDATFSFADDDFMAVSSGSINPQMAFVRGKMKIKGSMSAAQKFTPDIFPKPSKL